MEDNKFFLPLPRAVGIAKSFLAEILEPGVTVVDATAGNGNDTMFLARAVGETGKVFAFDIQEEALEKTSQRLRKEGLESRVTLLCRGHEYLQQVFEEYCIKMCRAVIFNLGYLPGGSSEIKTAPKTTLSAVEQSVDLLSPGGRLSIVVYRGHSGAQEEAREVDELVSSLDSRYYWTARITFPNRDKESPYVILVHKDGGGRK